MRPPPYAPDKGYVQGIVCETVRLPCTGEVEKVVKDLGIQMNPSPRDLLSGADANEDEVSNEAIFTCTQHRQVCANRLDTTFAKMPRGRIQKLSCKCVGLLCCG